jgi:hypothetical protein
MQKKIAKAQEDEAMSQADCSQNGRELMIWTPSLVKSIIHLLKSTYII